jgi:branched-subunit amino acid ABC-type transport system permease component
MNWNFDILPNFVFTGLQNGAIYAVVAVALVLIFKATTLINFAQGELAMFGAFIVYVFAVNIGLWLWLSIIIGMVFSAALGALIERSLVRPFDPDDHLPVGTTRSVSCQARSASSQAGFHGGAATNTSRCWALDCSIRPSGFG